MTQTKTLMVFQSPWQGRRGFSRFDMDMGSGQLTPRKTVKVDRLMKKPKGGVDGLLLRPAWPTRRGLCVLSSGDSLQLREVVRGQVQLASTPLDSTSASFAATVSECLAFRRFAFTEGAQTLAFSDLESRLLGPQRTAFDIFPTTDFSPLAQLVRIVRSPALHAKLVADLADHRFDYPAWVDVTSSHPIGHTRARLS